MKSAICTLFEGHYHFGVAALSNSLYKNGFRGDIYVGYRGALPPWATSAQSNKALNWEGATSFVVTKGLNMHFLPLMVDYHLTNYKPDFMLKLWEGPAKDAEAMFYFDPDIVSKCSWSFYEEWAAYGVSLVHEIVANDMPANHPIRQKWRTILELNGEQVHNQICSYINAGYIGLIKEHSDFLKKFSKFIQIAEKQHNTNLYKFDFTDRTDPFFAKDQDALNLAAMATSSPLSEMGPEAMDFIPSGFTMSHAVGGPKPWKKNFFKSVLAGIPPSMAEKAYWNYVNGPILTTGSRSVRLKNLEIKISALIGRFYRKR